MEKCKRSTNKKKIDYVLHECTHACMFAHLYTDFFDHDVCNAIRNGFVSFPDTWKSYREYHNRFEPVKATNGILLMLEFRNVYDEIASEIQKQPHALRKFSESKKSV